MRKTLEKRIINTLGELYRDANNVFGMDVSWDDLVQFCNDNKGMDIPWYAFYVAKDTFDGKVKEASKGLRSYWQWPWKIYYVYDKDAIDRKYDEIAELMSDPEGNSFYIKRLQEEIEFNPTARQRNEQFDEYCHDRDELDNRLHNKEITRKEYNAENRRLAKMYNLEKRSRDRELVSYNVNNYGPSTCYDMYLSITNMYLKVPPTDAGVTEEEFERIVRNAGIFDGVKERLSIPSRIRSLYVMMKFEDYMKSKCSNK